MGYPAMTDGGMQQSKLLGVKVNVEGFRPGAAAPLLADDIQCYNDQK